MKLINFNDESIGCVSHRQWKRLNEISKHVAERNAHLLDEATKQLYVVCLSHDTGVRLNLDKYFYREAEMPDFKVVESEIYCECAVIQYSNSKGHWVLSIAPDVKFQTLETAIGAAMLCKDKKNRLEQLQTIAANFPEYKEDLARDISFFEGVHNPGVE